MTTAPRNSFASGNGRPDLADDELEELCRLLLGSDRERLRETIERLSSRGDFVDWQSQTLADAMRLALARDPAFADSMGAMISKGVHTTVQRDSAAFGRALAPAMGPAIRSSVLMMLEGFVQSIENVVDQQLSWKSVRWRLEAWRKKRSFAEVVFLHTLLFRVEHAFLIHRENGVQLLHATRRGAIAREPDLIAAMLTAIQDFVGDAFEAPSGDALTSFRVGELQVVVENGSHAALAAVVRGQPRPEIRLQVRESLDRIETTMANALEAFDGDTEQFEAVRTQLEACLLESERTQGASKSKQKKKGNMLVRWALATAAIGLVTWWVIASVTASAERRRLDEFVTTLRAEPGFVVTEAVHADGALTLRGLRDPLARPFDEVAAEHAVTSSVAASWEPYHALRPEFVAQRVRTALAAPSTVEVGLRDGRVVVRGRADHAWRVRSRSLALAVPGVDAIDLTECADTDREAFDTAARKLRDLDTSLTELRQPTGETRRAFTTLLREMTVLAIRLQRDVRLESRFVWWSADENGAAAREARGLVADLAREHGVRIDLVGYDADSTVRNGLLRFTAVLVE